MKSFLLDPRDDGCCVYYQNKVGFINGTPEKVCAEIIKRIKYKHLQFCNITVAESSEAFYKYTKILNNNNVAYDCILSVGEEEILKELFVKGNI